MIKRKIFFFILILCSTRFLGQGVVVRPISYVEKQSIFEDEEKLFDIFWMLIISYESYSEKAYEDHGRFSRGFGTHADYEGQPITLKDAIEASKNAYRQSIDFIKGEYPHLDVYTTHLIAAFQYNVTHGRWGGIKNTIHKGNLNDIANSLILYVKASGEVQGGLVKRRYMEAEYLLVENERCLMELHQRSIQRFIRKNSKDLFDKLASFLYL